MQCFDELSEEPLTEGAFALNFDNREIAEYRPEFAPVSEFRVDRQDFLVRLEHTRRHGFKLVDQCQVLFRCPK